MGDRSFLVPMRLDVYLNYAPRLKVATDPRQRAYLAPIQQPNFKPLSHSDSLLQHDIFEHTHNRPYMSTADPYRKDDSRTGIYIHWNLPDMYRHGFLASKSSKKTAQGKLSKSGYPNGDAQSKYVQSGAPIFRPVPNRWLLLRTCRGTLSLSGKLQTVSAAGSSRHMMEIWIGSSLPL